VAVRFVAAGRVQWLEAGDVDYMVGERVVVDADRGTRLAWIATVPERRAVRDRGMRRVIRRADDRDLRDSDDAGRTQGALRAAKDIAAALRLPLKVFRVELAGGKAFIYYTSDERVDVRDFVRDLAAHATLRGARIELRQLGARDEAKVVGGIGSCGLTLCCTTWLPEFVPVSIKMAKDQGLVLAPSKVSGQCGRLKCCLVYEQAGYAELRKGLPKLGKRVITARGEGRVVEVDVLRQRLRVSYAPGEQEVLPASEVKPMFPSGGQGQDRSEAEHELDAGSEPESEPEIDDPDNRNQR
jgi:cell fate regulator YaaT (PSP1 superfamily)